MQPPSALDWGHLALAALAFGGGFLWVSARRRLAAALDRAKALEAEAASLKIRPSQWGCRIQAFDVLWFTTVEFSPADKRILSAVPGVPHCKACVRPLSTTGGRGEWVCAACAAKFPESLVDAMATDSVVREALAQFCAGHPGYRPPARQ